MIKDIVVHLDGTERDEDRLAHAELMATSFDAHLLGLFTNLIEIGYIAADPVGASVEIVAGAIEEARNAGDVTEARLRARLQQLSCLNELRRFDGTDGELREHAAAAARTSDIFVVSRPLGSDEQMWPGLFQAALFSGGRSVYVVPPSVAPKPIRTVVVGWRDSREATRALYEAMPILKQAERVILASVGDEHRFAENADIARHLARHGVAFELKELAAKDRVSEVLLDECAESGADLLVIGAYGHSRFWEWVLGGTTRNILTISAVPVLLAH
ncbi:universal stress protein [Aureimonas fodinaquatilis]|uniref:Universal stress protein n=1 Tax=Aureimonas fodinaquatilis TaxID=2565783 RepID=A0A5B0DML5_9HYPH|nr:universal stress protein [Aureimonas fodinaquatilis]KAA0968117.1 universal stress protein [Aureimonas fodinaquatilis]